MMTIPKVRAKRQAEKQGLIKNDKVRSLRSVRVERYRQFGHLMKHYPSLRLKDILGLTMDRYEGLVMACQEYYQDNK